MHLKHYGTATGNINAFHSFPSTTGVRLTFDYMYDAMSPKGASGTVGGAYIGFYNASGKADQYIYIIKNADNSDASAKILYNNGGAKPSYTNIQKDKWYTIDAYVGRNSDGSSRIELKITCEGEVVYNQSFWCAQSVQIEKIGFSNGSGRV